MARNQNNHHVLPLFCDDLIASTVDMTPASFGAYMRILCYAWTRGGVPNDYEACRRIAGGMELCDWSAIRLRLVLLDSGTPNERLSHARLELERQKVAELKAKKSKAGKKGNRKRWENQGTDDTSHSDRTAIANASHNDRKTIAPTPTPTPTQEIHTHTPHTADSEFRKPGWAADEWARFVAVWNRTERAVPWTALGPPLGWVDLAASPGWLTRAFEAMTRLPQCQWYDQPLAVTRFFEHLDRILAGEFDNPKQDARKRRQPVGGNL